MKKTTKWLLRLSIVTLVPGVLFFGGWVGVGRFSGLYALFPVGVVFLGLCLLSKILEKVTAADALEEEEVRRHSSGHVGSGSQEPRHDFPASGHPQHT